MVEETIRTIRETENKADGIVKDAEEQSVKILAGAKEKADEASAQIIGNARAEAKASEEQTKRDGDLREAEALARAQEDIRALKASAMEREKEAVDLVISLLA